MQVNWLGAEQLVSSLQINRQAIVKLMRRTTPGVNTEVEMIRLLTERGYPAIEALKGEVTRHFRHGADSVMAIVQNFVPNQGDGFRWTIEQLKRVLDEQAIATGSGTDPFELYENFARRIGSRLGELHVALAAPSENADFAPEPIGEETIAAWQESVSYKVEAALAVLEQDSNPPDRERAELIGALRAHRQKLAAAVAERLRRSRGAVKTRVHGNLDLSHVLVAADDVVFTDFGGDPVKPIEERRAKTHALRDAAGMLRSFDFAAKVAEHEEHVAQGGAGEERAGVVLEDFRRVAQFAFLKGYEDGRGAPLSSAEQDLLAVFALEKAAQECIAAAGQPEWLDVPLKGFARLAEQLVQSAS
jgi:maltose alpha-D-glucosyltransferase/alpha-amylase